MTEPRTMAEMAVLGACLIDRDAMPKVLPILTTMMFEGQQHRRIFRAMGALNAQGTPIDVITVCEELRRAGKFDRADLEYLAQILDAVPTAVHVEAHAEIVRSYAAERYPGILSRYRPPADPLPWYVVRLVGALHRLARACEDVADALTRKSSTPA